MQLRKNNFLRVALLLVGSLVITTPASAAGLLPIGNDGTVCPFNGLTERVILCISSVLNATVVSFLIPFSSYMQIAINACMLLAVILFGWLMLSGRIRPVARESIVLALKIGFIVFLINGSVGLYSLIIGIMDEMVAMVINYVNYAASGRCPPANTPWALVDCMLDRLIGGILPGSAIASGMAGFVIASLFSGAVGIPIFLLGIIFIFIILMAILQALFIYINAYIGVALLAMMAPLMIPMVLFKATKARFEKWLNLMIGLIIQPIFLFAYLTMLMITFNIVVFSAPNSLYRAIAGPFADVDNPAFTIGDNLNAVGAFAERDMLDFKQNVDPRELAGILSQPGAVVDLGALGNLGQSAQQLSQQKNIAVGLPAKAVDYEWMSVVSGKTYTQYIIDIIASFFSGVTIAYIFYTLLQVIPFLGQGISGEMLSIPNLARGLLGQNGNIMNTLRGNMGLGKGGS